MTGGEEEQKKGENKGFAGLSSLVSDVDTTSPQPAPKKEPAASAPNAGQSAQPRPQPNQQRQTYQEPAQPSSGGSSAGKWVLGIAAVIGVFWLIGQANKTTTTSSAPAYYPPEQTATPSYAPPAETQAPSRPEESMPPVGQNQVLSTAQIRYCLAEDIRMESAKSAINNYIDADVDRFNAMVADYNSRCSSFRYQTNNRGRNDLNSAQRDIEPFKVELQNEGRGRFTRYSVSSATSLSLSQMPESSISNNSALESALLNAMRLKPGTLERLGDSGKAIAAIANAGFVNLKPDERVDYSDYRIVRKPFFVLGQELVVIDEEYFDVYVGCCVSPGVAITVKISGSLDQIQNFAQENRCTLSRDSDEYYLEPQISIPDAPKGTYAQLSCKERDAR